MYIPKSFAENDLPTVFAFVAAHPFATMVTHAVPDGLFATHLPLVLDPMAGPFGTLTGHIARANQYSRGGEGQPAEALVIFAGPDAHITPSWYPTKREAGHVVPTWNYVAVHAYGRLRLNEDPAFMRAHLESLTRRHERERGSPWDVGDAPEDYLARQMQAIVCVEIRLDRIEAKWKMSQNRPATDIDGVLRGLGESAAPADQAVVAIMRARRPPSE